MQPPALGVKGGTRQYGRTWHSVETKPNEDTMNERTSKAIAVKFIGSKRATETLQIMPGTTVTEVLKTLNLSAGYQLSDAQNPDIVFRPADVLYAMVEDGALLYASALVDAGV